VAGFGWQTVRVFWCFGHVFKVLACEGCFIQTTSDLRFLWWLWKVPRHLTSCGLVDPYQHIRRTCCLTLQRSHTEDRNSHSFCCPSCDVHSLFQSGCSAERSNASSFNPQYPVIFLRSYSSCLCLLPHLPVTSNLSSIFPSMMRFRRQFLCKMWPTQLAFLFYHCL